ncbi:MAG: 30S ribosomal protein S8 [Anaerolineales bacterium]|nr:30S ribosomal protein S8 [Anaerolineales bacterium]
MSVSDPISDMLTRVRNAIMAGNSEVTLPSSKIKIAIAGILKAEGFIEEYQEVTDKRTGFKNLRLDLRYVGVRRERQSVIQGLRRVSRPGRRVYVGKTEIPWVQAGLGVAILSTPKGVMSGVRARQLGVGGEVLCEIW